MTTIIPLHTNCGKEIGIQLSSDWLSSFKKDLLNIQCDNCGATCIISQIAATQNLQELEIMISGKSIDTPESPEKTF